MEVYVFVAVDIPHPRAEASIDPDRLRVRDLPAGGDTSGE
jgi:hypothetical protein